MLVLICFTVCRVYRKEIFNALKVFRLSSLILTLNMTFFVEELPEAELPALEKQARPGSRRGPKTSEGVSGRRGLNA